MNRLLLIAALMVFAATPCFAFNNEPEGFRDFKWGDGIEDHPELRFVQDTSRKWKYFRIVDENLKIGPIRAHRIYYKFRDGIFAETTVNLRSLKDCKYMRGAFSEQFGKPTEIKSIQPAFGNDDSDSPRTYKWLGKSANVILWCDSDNSRFNFESVRWKYKESTRTEKRKAKKVFKDL